MRIERRGFNNSFAGRPWPVGRMCVCAGMQPTAALARPPKILAPAAAFCAHDARQRRLTTTRGPIIATIRFVILIGHGKRLLWGVRCIDRTPAAASKSGIDGDVKNPVVRLVVSVGRRSPLGPSFNQTPSKRSCGCLAAAVEAATRGRHGTTCERVVGPTHGHGHIYRAPFFALELKRRRLSLSHPLNAAARVEENATPSMSRSSFVMSVVMPLPYSCTYSPLVLAHINVRATPAASGRRRSRVLAHYWT